MIFLPPELNLSRSSGLHRSTGYLNSNEQVWGGGAKDNFLHSGVETNVTKLTRGEREEASPSRGHVCRVVLLQVSVDVARYFGPVDEIRRYFVLFSGNRRSPEVVIFPPSLGRTQ